MICLGVSYLLGDDDAAADGGDDDGGAASVGRVARYARVRDYHRAMKRRMRGFVRGLEPALGESVAARWYVDDGPMLDRAAANRAGIGWFGKNTNILTAGHGSWVLLGQVITDLPLTPDAPLKKSCGACVRCIDDCPTGAIVAPYVVDNARCISYLTIENREPIPRGTASANRGLGFRLRHLPGRLPGEPQGAAGGIDHKEKLRALGGLCG